MSDRSDRIASAFEIRRKDDVDGGYELYLNGEFVPWAVSTEGLEIHHTEVERFKFVQVRLFVEGDIKIDPSIVVTNVGDGVRTLRRPQDISKPSEGGVL
ncbi:hypothetical protein [Rhodococcus sp. B10]|uniref:hypothetical protein n=1 Tax=Rhodococcus sp. B10 TaxID=2695876 RepID=UPI001430EAFD|nr:hypothetical protein [Rhodococcus sp. B10]NIL77648.1 hypothetical protein [Rhodococcus sp. B10]